MFANIKNIISAIGAITGLLSLIKPITDLIHEVEVSGVSGPEKKAAVLAIIQSAVLTVESSFGIDLPDSLVLGFAGNIIDVIVSVENMLGRLKHSDPAVPLVVIPTVITVDAGVPIVVKAAIAGKAVKAAIPTFDTVAPSLLVSKNFPKA